MQQLNSPICTLITLLQVLFNLTSASLCLLLAIACEDVGVANLLGTLVMLFKYAQVSFCGLTTYYANSLLFAGLFLNRRSVTSWLRWLFTISFFHASYEDLAVNELRYLSIQEEEVRIVYARDLMLWLMDHHRPASSLKCQQQLYFRSLACEPSGIGPMLDSSLECLRSLRRRALYGFTCS